MGSEHASLLAILGMAGVTFATRAGGLWLTSRWSPPPRVAAALRRVPGAVLTAMVVPALLGGGAGWAVAAAATVLVAARTGSMAGAMAAGVAVAWLLRAAG